MTFRKEMFASPLPPDLTSAVRVDGSLDKIGFKGKAMVSSGTDGAVDAATGAVGLGATAAGLAEIGTLVLGETGGGAGVAFFVGGGGATG